MLFPWSNLRLCKHCWVKRIARDANRCPGCGGNLPAQYLFPLDHVRLYFRNPLAALEPLLGWFVLLIILLVLINAMTSAR